MTYFYDLFLQGWGGPRGHARPPRSATGTKQSTELRSSYFLNIVLVLAIFATNKFATSVVNDESKTGARDTVLVKFL